jgi:anti-sigma factor RsiW
MDVQSGMCHRIAELVSRDLDGELSRFEQAMFRRHIERCQPCAERARAIVGATHLLRAVPLERVTLPVIPIVPSLRTARLVRTAGAAAAMAAVGVWLGVSSSGSRSREVPTFSPRPTANVIDKNHSDWAAGLPRTREIVQLVPGGLRTADIDP